MIFRKSALFVFLFLLFSSFVIPPEEEMRIDNALKGYGVGGAYQLTPLTGGVDHLMFLARFETGECVVRLLRQELPLKAILREVEATELASEKCVGPKFFHFDPHERVLLLEFLSPDGSEVDEEKMIKKLRAFQHLSFSHTQGKIEPFAFLDALYQQVCKQEKAPLFERIREAMEIIEFIYSLIQREPAVMCHGDFHQHNVIMSRQEAYLIDWTTAAPGDRFYDLAKYTLPFSEERRERVLEIYCGGDVTPVDRAHFLLTRMATLMTLVLNRYPFIENVSLDTFESTDVSVVSFTAMATDEEKRLGALKALRLFFDLAHSEELFRTLVSKEVQRILKGQFTP